MNGSEWTRNYGKGIAGKGHEKRMKDMKGSVDIKENKENGRKGHHNSEFTSYLSSRPGMGAEQKSIEA